jgi:hypothetical protein
MELFLEQHSAGLTVLILIGMVLGTLLVLVPQLLRVRQNALEQQHIEHMRALEQGQPCYVPDEQSRYAGRTASLVPMVVVCVAGTVTCFLVAYKSESLFSLALTVWCVAGVISLAAITGGVALLGRLAQLSSDEDDEPPHNPLKR